MELFLTIFTPVALFLIGATVFSFLNILSERYARMQTLFSGALICENCQKEKRVWELIPIFSFLFLWGECRHCGEKLSRIGFVNELAGGALFVLLYFRFGERPDLTTPFLFHSVLDINLDFGFYKFLGLFTLLLWTSLLDLVFLIDLRTMEIPDVLNYIIFGVSVVSLLTVPGMSIPTHLIGFVVTALPLLLLTLAIPGAFGGGDIRLLAATGLLLGWKLALLALFIGIVGGGVYGGVMMAAKKLKKGDHFAFGPYLCVGFMIAMIAGNDIISLYLGLVR